MLMFSDSIGQDSNKQKLNSIKKGYIIVEVLDSNKAPLSSATVIIYSEQNANILTYKVVHAGINGETEPICTAGSISIFSPCVVLTFSL